MALPGAIVCDVSSSSIYSLRVPREELRFLVVRLTCWLGGLNRLSGFGDALASCLSMLAFDASRVAPTKLFWRTLFVA